MKESEQRGGRGGWMAGAQDGVTWKHLHLLKNILKLMNLLQENSSHYMWSSIHTNAAQLNLQVSTGSWEEVYTRTAQRRYQLLPR